jgi:hypothetical protein
MTWPAGTDLGVFSNQVTLASNVTVPFEGIIPAGANVQLSDASVPTRPANADGEQGAIFAIAPMLPQGDMSWSVRLVAGADLDAADTRIVKPASLLKKLGVDGNITLLDQHLNLTQASTVQVPKFKYYYYYGGVKYGTYYTNNPSSYGCSHFGNIACLPAGYDTVNTPASINGPNPSVLRTGTGNLDLIAGGSFNEQSLFGVYTAGTQSAPLHAPDGSDPYQQPRGVGSSLVPDPSKAAAVEATYAAWYPEHGGDLLLSAQGSATGFNLVTNNTTIFVNSDLTANWLWRQGGGGLTSAPTAWWINFGTYAQTSPFANDSSLVGFQGIGTLGGGNLTVIADRAGGGSVPGGASTAGLDLVVGSTGRVLADGTVVETGGGDLIVKVNSLTGGNLADLRGDISVIAGSVGDVSRGGSTVQTIDPRTLGPDDIKFSNKTGGPTLVPGDGTISITTRGDAVFGDTVDAGMTDPLDLNGLGYTVINSDGSATNVGGGAQTKFTLWSPTSAVSLFSAGGEVGSQSLLVEFMPASLSLIAANGDVYLQSAPDQFHAAPQIELMPSPTGQLAILAAGSIYGGREKIGMSGAAMDSLATPLHPWSTGSAPDNSSASGAVNARFFDNTPIAFGPDTPTGNLHAGDDQPGLIYAGKDISDLQIGWSNAVFASGFFQPDPLTWYVGAKPFRVIAGRDILGSGDATGGASDVFFNNTDTGITLIRAGRDILFQSVQIAGGGVLDVEAGRDLMQGSFGTLESVGPLFNFDPTNPTGGADIVAMAGVGPTGPDYSDFANLYLNPANAADPTHPLADQPGKALQTPGTVTAVSDLAGWLKSQFGYTGDSAGALAFFEGLSANDRARYPSDPTLFAWMKETQGYTGNQGGALAAFLGLSSASQSQFTYNAMMFVWLQQRFGYAGTQADAYAYFIALPKEQQGVFVRSVYYDELTQGGREFNDPSSERFQSYLRGRDAIAALFPTKDAAGDPITYTGDITLFTSATTNSLGQPVQLNGAIRTDFGGNIQILNPGGQTLVGTEGVVPGPLAGLLTQGQGDIDVFSEGSILLGESRILTTFGGDILAWSSDGDINSGRGSKTTIIFSPPRRVYDDYGNITLSPPVPSSGAGIGTLAPFAQVAPGDVDLIAPLGTVDAGEAGIRVSGNVNIAALHVVNAANIEVKGNAVGIPVVAAVDTGALTAASGVSAAVSSIAEQIAERARPKTVPPTVPYIVVGTFLGFGE